MLQYLLTVWHDHPEHSYQGAHQSDEVLRDAFAKVDAFNTKLTSANKLVFACGLQEPTTALTARGDDVTTGPFSKDSRFVGGFWVVEVESADEAQALAVEGSLACGQPVEARPLQG